MTALQRFSVLAVSIVVLSGCYSIEIHSMDPGTVPPREHPETMKEFWKSVRHLDLEHEYSKLNEDESRVLQALREAERFNNEVSDSLLFNVSVSSVDSAVKRTAFIILEKRLTDRGEWQTILDLYRLTERTPPFLPMVMNTTVKESLLYPVHPETLSVERSVLGVPIVDVTVNGIRKRFWLDTGASEMVLSRTTAEECGVTVVDSVYDEVTTATTTIPGNISVLSQCSLGPLTMKNIPAVILEDKYLNTSILGIFRYYTIDGIVGWRMLRNVRLTFDLPEERIIIERSVKGVDVRRNVIWMEYPLMRFVNEEGKSMLFFFDSGAKKSSAHPYILEHLSELKRRMRLNVFYGIGGHSLGIGESIDRLELRSGSTRVCLRNLPVTMVGRQDFVRIDGIIGADLLWKRRVVFDYPNRTFTIE